MARRLRTKCIFKNVHPQNSNHLRSHSRAITPLDHSRLGLGNKFSGKQIRPNFLRSTSLLTKSCQQNLGVCKSNFYNRFLYITSEMKQYYLSYRPLTECSISQFFKTNCTQSIFRTINRGLLTKPFKKFLKSPL